MIALAWISLYLLTHLVMAETTTNPSKLKHEAIVSGSDIKDNKTGIGTPKNPRPP